MVIERIDKSKIDPAYRKVIQVLGVIVIIIALGVFSTVFYKPVFFVRVITFLMALLGLTLPVMIGWFFFSGEADVCSVLKFACISVPFILFFGIMLPISGTVGMPGLLNIVQPVVCPAGFDDIQGGIAARQFDMPGKVISVKMVSFCTGELGAYQPGRGALMLGGIFMNALYYAIYFSIVLAVRKQKFFVLNGFAAQGLILAIFIPVLFVTLLNPSFGSIVSRPVKGLIYRGHAISLVEAVKRHKVNVIKDLLARGGDIYAKNDQHETALGIAQKFNDKEALDLFAGQITGGSDAKNALLGKGIVYDAPNFFKCVVDNNIECVKLFLDAGMDINALGSYQGSTPVPYDTALAMAAKKGYKDLVELLLDRKADVNAANARPGAYGRTPLHIAAQECRDDFVKLLIQRGADVNIRDKYGYTVLMIASGALGSGCPAAVPALVENKADVNARKADGMTALLFAVDNASYDSVVDTKTYFKVDVLNKEKYGLVKYLLEHGADPNVNSFDTGMTPLRIARANKFKEVVELLQQYHARE